MAVTAVDAPSKQELLERAEQLKPVLQRNAAAAEQDRRIPQESIDALADAGLFKLTVPKRFGGYEVPFDTKLAVSAKVAEACGSTAWVLTLTNVCNWFIGLTNEQTQQDIYGENPDARVCGVLTPSSTTVRDPQGGLRVTGRWGYGSGSLHADWALLGVPVVDEAGEPIDQGIAFIPIGDLTIEDTWFVSGMKGTGSNTLVAEDVFVPDHRIFSVPPAIGNVYATPHTDEALYRSSFIPVLALVLAGPIHGLARAAVDLVIEKAPKRTVAYTVFERQTDSTAFQLAVSDARMLVDSAGLHIERAARDIDEAAARGESLDYLTRARVRADTAWAIRRSLEAIEKVISANGAGSFAEVSPLQRHWRDANIAARHAVVLGWVNQEIYGKALLGIPYEENITPLI